MIGYRKGDSLVIATPGGSPQTFRVEAIAPDPVDPYALSLTLSRAQEPTTPALPATLADALRAVSEPAIPVGPLAEKLAAYSVRPVKVGKDEVGGLMVEHEPCVWFQLLSAKIGMPVPHLLAVVLEHHMTGCKVPR